MSGKYKTNEIYSIKSFFLKTKLTQIKTKWVIYHRLETVNVCQSTGTWFPHQIWSILPHRCHFNVWIWSVGTPHKQKQRLPRTTERLLKKGPSSFDAQGNVKRFSAKIQSFVSQFRAPRHVGHPKGFAVTRTFQSIHELLQSSSLKIEVNPFNSRPMFFQKVLVTRLHKEICCWALRI